MITDAGEDGVQRKIGHSRADEGARKAIISYSRRTPDCRGLAEPLLLPVRPVGCELTAWRRIVTRFGGRHFSKRCDDPVIASPAPMHSQRRT